MFTSISAKTMPASPCPACRGYLCLSQEIYLAAYRRIAAFFGRSVRFFPNNSLEVIHEKNSGARLAVRDFTFDGSGNHIVFRFLLKNMKMIISYKNEHKASFC